MSRYGSPILYALFVWWFSTGAIIFLDNLPRRTFRWSMAGATVVAAFALVGLAVSATDTSVAGVYTAFTCTLLVWGWQEMAFLMGFLTGPRRHACPEGCSGWRHFGHAVQACIYHELGLLFAAAAVFTVTRGGENQIGIWTFVLLWVMRLSAKLNLVLGVRNLSEELLPEHLRYLTSFLRRKPMNLLFPVSVTVGTVAVVLLAQRAMAADAGAFAVTGWVFLATMLTLAVLEHWLLMLPLPSTALWRWSLRARRPVGALRVTPLDPSKNVFPPPGCGHRLRPPAPSASLR